MKIVYSYITYNFDKNRLMSLDVALTAYISVLQARKYYGEVVLYTNKHIKEQVLELGIPFTHIDTEILAEELALCPSIPKLKTYVAQNEPYIHIDLDTILFNKLPIEKTKPVIFAHLDSNSEYPMTVRDYESIHKAYILPFYDNVLPDYYKDIVLNLIPNMNIVAVNETALFKEQVKKSLQLYQNNREYFNTEYYRFCTIEQLSIFAELLNSSSEFKEIVQDEYHVLHENETNLIHGETLPMSIKINNFIEKEIHIDTIDDINKLVNENFGGYLHLCGNYKTNPVMQAYILYMLDLKYNKEPLVKLEKYFGTLEKLNGYSLYEKIENKVI